MNLELLIERVVRETINKVMKLENHPSYNKVSLKSRKRALLILPYQCLNVEYTLKRAFQIYGEYKVRLLSSDSEKLIEKYEGLAVLLKFDSAKGNATVIEELDSISSVCLISPSLSLLIDIINLNDTGYVQSLILNSLICGKEIRVILGEEYSSVHLNELNRRIQQIFNQISSLGIEIDFAKKIGEGLEIEREVKMDLITERDVVEFYAKGATSISLLQGRIVTPLAADKAKELGIKLQSKES